MKGQIWVQTYRRPLEVVGCVDSFRGLGMEITVIHPWDEKHEMLGVTSIALPKWWSDKGAGPPRAMAGYLAGALGHDYMVIVEDDARLKRASDLPRLVEALFSLPRLATIQGRSAFPCKSLLNPGIEDYGAMGIVTVIKMEPYLEVGGFDPTLPRLEDNELAFRLKVAGYSLGSLRDVAMIHRNFSSGGLSVTEVTDSQSNKEAAVRHRVAVAPRVVAKYPGWALKETVNGYPRWQRGALERLQGLYREGKIRCTVMGVVEI